MFWILLLYSNIVPTSSNRKAVYGVLVWAPMQLKWDTSLFVFSSVLAQIKQINRPSTPLLCKLLKHVKLRESNN